MSRLNPIEKESQEVLLLVQEMLSPRWDLTFKQKKLDFTELLGHVRRAVIHLTNKEFGCASGRHSGPCACTETTVARRIK
jgi:hypothetical protein